ncbi:Golgi CORVET complex core vacuolar protein 8-domain-containing protein [Phlyctochytrium arcticum]|nr:Golgi CORVET complex core vacuolar protein 8-domain-containing protein [Phlyctochytrium arcticum]
MADLGSLEETSDIAQEPRRPGTSYAESGSSEGVGMPTSNPVVENHTAASTGWRPFGFDIRVPRWGRRTTGSSLSRATSEDRLSVNSSATSSSDVWSGGANVRAQEKRLALARYELERFESIDNCVRTIKLRGEGDEESAFRQVIISAFDTCLTFDRAEMLFNEIYDQFCHLGREGLFFETLESYILDERITTFSNPVIIQDFMTFYEKQSYLDRLEQVILHLDPSGIDVHRTVGICIKYGLYSALFYVYNGVGDYVTPIVELLRLMEAHDSSNSQPESDAASNLARVLPAPLEHSFEDAVYILFVYLSYVLSGKAFPVGTLTTSEAIRAKEDVYSFLFSPRHATWPPGQKIQKIGAEPYPYIKLLFDYDHREFLKATSAVLADERLELRRAKIQHNVFTADNLNQDMHSTFGNEISRQFILDTLLSAIGDGDVQNSDLLANGGQEPATILASSYDFYIFVANAIAKYHESLHIEADIAAFVMLRLVMCQNPMNIAERENGVLAIFLIGIDPATTPERLQLLLQLLEVGGMWQAYEYLARQHRRPDLVFLSYLNDPTRSNEAAAIAGQLLKSREYDDVQREQVSDSVLRSVPLLIRANELSATLLVAQYFSGSFSSILDGLQENTEDYMAFLRGMLDPEYALARRGADEQSFVALRKDRQRRAEAITKLHLKATHFETYIRLLCIHNPSEVKRFLSYLAVEYSEYPYSFGNVLRICKENNVTEGVVWILEKSGDLEGAVSHVMEAVPHLVAQCITSADNSNGMSVESKSLELLRNRMDMGTAICSRVSDKLPKSEREELWFHLLDFVLEAQRGFLPSSPTTSNGMGQNLQPNPAIDLISDLLRNGTRTMLFAMVGHVTLPAILARIAQAKRKSTIGEHRDIIFSMLDSYGYERELLQATSRILNTDVHGAHEKDISVRKRALRPNAGQCGVCRRILHVRAMSEQQKLGKVVITSCRHAYHASCLQSSMEQIAEAEGRDVRQVGRADLGEGWCVVCSKGKSVATKAVTGLSNGIRANNLSHSEKQNEVHNALNKPILVRNTSVPDPAPGSTLQATSAGPSLHKILKLLDPHPPNTRPDAEDDDVIDLGDFTASHQMPFMHQEPQAVATAHHGCLLPFSNKMSSIPSIGGRSIPCGIILSPYQYALVLEPPRPKPLSENELPTSPDSYYTD